MEGGGASPAAAAVVSVKGKREGGARRENERLGAGRAPRRRRRRPRRRACSAGSGALASALATMGVRDTDGLVIRRLGRGLGRRKPARAAGWSLPRGYRGNSDPFWIAAAQSRGGARRKLRRPHKREGPVSREKGSRFAFKALKTKSRDNPNPPFCVKRKSENCGIESHHL